MESYEKKLREKVDKIERIVDKFEAIDDSITKAFEVVDLLANLEGLERKMAHQIIRENPEFHYDDEDFVKHFAFCKEDFLELLNIFGEDLKMPKSVPKSSLICPARRLAIFLQYLRVRQAI